MAGKPHDEQPSTLLLHILRLSDYHECGAAFDVNDLSFLEWEALRILRNQRHKAELKRLKQK